MLAHDDINERFVRMDTIPVLTEARLGRWLVWPIVKERLWLLCRNQWHEDRRSSTLSASVDRLYYGLHQVTRALTGGGRCTTAVLYKPRLVQVPTAKAIDPFLGDLQSLEQNGPILYYAFGVETGRQSTVERMDLDFFGVGAVMAVLARFVRKSAKVKRLAKQVLPPIEEAIPEVPAAILEAVIVDELARFECRRVFTRLLLRRRDCRHLIVLDPDGKTPEVAAARELEIPVIEVQHGMFCNQEPEYSWTSVHREIASSMPVPDSVVVFGRLWKQQLLDAGYWRDDEVMEAENAVISSYRQLMKERAPKSPDAPMTVFYPTQQYVRSAALDFWGTFLEGLRRRNTHDVRLRIKLHPDERLHADAYRALFDTYPDLCTLVPEGNDAFEEMMNADIVAGYSSLAMMEALGLGLPVVSLRGGPAAQGFVGIFGMPELSSVFFETEDADALAERLSGPSGLAFLDEWGQTSRDNAYLAYSAGVEPIEALLQRITRHD